MTVPWDLELGSDIQGKYTKRPRRYSKKRVRGSRNQKKTELGWGAFMEKNYLFLHLREVALDVAVPNWDLCAKMK